MTPLDSSVLNALDLDLPRDVLRFSIVKPPRHGSIVSHGSEGLVNKRREAGLPSTVVDFTMSSLVNGEVNATHSDPNTDETNITHWFCTVDKMSEFTN